MKRRDFISQTSTLALTAMAGSASVIGGLLPARGWAQENSAGQADSSCFQLRYILPSSLYGTLPLEEILPEVKKIGSNQIDLWPPPHGDQRKYIELWGEKEFKKRLADRGVQCAVLTRFDLSLTAMEEEVRLLARLEGKTILTTYFRSKDKPRPKTIQEEVDLAIEALTPLAKVAKQEGIRIAIETHTNAFLDTIESVEYFVRCAPESLGLALAPYHLPQEPQRLAKLIETVGTKLYHFYAWEHGHGCMKPMPKEEEMTQMPGRGTFDFKPLLAALRQIDYKNPASVFMHPTPRGIPIRESLAKVTNEILHAQNHLNSLLKGE